MCDPLTIPKYIESALPKHKKEKNMKEIKYYHK